MAEHFTSTTRKCREAESQGNKEVVEEIEDQDGNRIPNINFILDVGEGKVEELITYNQLLDHLEQAEEQDNFMDQELYTFIAIIGHEALQKRLIPLERE